MDNKYKHTTTTQLGMLGLICLIFMSSLSLRAADPECPENPNLVQAGFYALDKIYPWSAITKNDAEGTIEAAQLYVGKLSTTTLATSPNIGDVITRQSFAGIKPGVTYEVTFFAKVSNGADFKVSVSKFYGNYWPVTGGAQTYTPANDQRNEYSFQFTAEENLYDGLQNWVKQEDAQFRFEFAFGSALGSLEFDGIEVRDVSSSCTLPTAVTIENCPEDDLFLGAPLNLNVSFEPETTDVTDITWSTNDNTVVKVEDGELVIVGSGDAIITATTYNDKTTTCSVTVGSENVATCTHPEIVIDGGFDVDASNWEHYKKPETDAAGTMTIESTDMTEAADGTLSDALKVDITGINDPINESDHQLKHRMSVLQNGFEYKLKFTAKADAARTIAVKVIPNSAPWTGSLDESIDLTTTAQNFEFDFTYGQESGRSFAVDFFLGQAIQTVWIDNVSLVATSGDCFATTSVEILDCPDSNLEVIDPTNLEDQPAAKAQLTAEVKPSYAIYNSVQWTSSDVTVAVVDGNGLITGLADGTAEIVATSTYFSNLKSTCSIIVGNPTVDVESISISGCATDEVEIGANVTITHTVLPSDATDKTASWSSSDATVATVDANGKVTFIGAGKVTITATSTSGSKTATCEMTVKAEETITSVTEAEVNGLTLYPNPLNGAASLTILSKDNSPISITIMEMNGKVVSTKKFENAKKAVISRSSFGKAGLYLIRVENNLGSTVRKVQIN